MQQETRWLLQEKYNGQKSDAWLADCARLETGEPLAYVIGHVPFLDCVIWLSDCPDLVPPISSSKRHQKFRSDDRTGISVKKFTLIPRPETEYWVEHAITAITQSTSSKPKILDLCAGSGCVGVAVAKALPTAQVDFAELDTTHHLTIKKNIAQNLLPITRDRCQIFSGDLFSSVPLQNQYDFILSNPPYIDPALDRTEVSVKDYEPEQALYGGVAGMEIIARIIAEAPAYLTPTGELWLEHEPEQAAAITTLAQQQRFTCHTFPDQYDVERYSRLVLQYPHA